jgi:hypothetical protein
MGPTFILCDLCNKKQNIVYICPICKEKHCKEHKSPKSHNCNSLINMERMNLPNYWYYPKPNLRESIEIIKNNKQSESQNDRSEKLYHKIMILLNFKVLNESIKDALELFQALLVLSITQIKMLNDSSFKLRTKR